MTPSNAVQNAPDPHAIRTFGSVHRYHQGPGAIGLLGSVCKALGKRPLLVCDQIVHGLVYQTGSQSCEAHGLSLPWICADTEVTRVAVAKLVEQARAIAADVDIVVAAGGGKGVDTGKAVARELGAQLVVIPTAASNDGPCSKAFVFYDDAHRMDSVEYLGRNPDAVLVDTSLLVKAPRALLVSGIGDAICKLYEGDQVRAVNGLNLFGGVSTIAVMALAEACDRVIREDAEEGLKALEQGATTPAFERLVEALVLLSGLSFENSGLSIAHSMTRGLPRIDGVHTTLHGQHVAYGLLVQLLLEGRDAGFIQEQLAFHRRVGLATRLADLGATQTDEAAMRTIAQGTMQSPHIGHFQTPLDEEKIVRAMQQLEEMSRA